MNRVDLFGVSIHNLTLEETLLSIRDLARGGGRHYVTTLNVDHAVRLQKDPEFLAAYRGASLVVADGMPVLWASRLLGVPLKERVTGSDLVPRACQMAAGEGLAVFFFGGNAGMAEAAARNLQKRWPTLRVAGAYFPPFGFERSDSENEKAVQALNAAGADLIFLALGAPKQEKWIARSLPSIRKGVALCVGSALDYPAGTAKRAPDWMQRAGLEWLWRLLGEPRRLARRYLVEDMAFIGIVVRELICRRR